MINEQKLDDILLELGHDDFNLGTAYIRLAVKDYRPGIGMTRNCIRAWHGPWAAVPPGWSG